MFDIVFLVDNIERSIYLPTVPRIGESVYIGTCTIRVTNVTYTANKTRIFLEVEKI